MDILFYTGWLIFAASLGYLLVACFCVLKFKSKLAAPALLSQTPPGVTLYKPLHGLDYQMAANLSSFFKQDYPVFEIVFGVSSADDPAIPVVRDLIAEHPAVTATLIINNQSNGANPKVSNLINMDVAAKNEILIISDSDMRVGPDYITRVVAGFEDERVGLVTCLYMGTPAPGIASHLGAMFISQWFTPSALIPATFGEMTNCFGATMALKRSVLQEIGGFFAISGNLADDYTLGRLVREAGYTIHLANVVVDNWVEESSLKSLVLHELRWARTIRFIEPAGFLTTFLTDTVPLAVLLGVISSFSGYGWSLVFLPLILALFARTLLHFSTKVTFSSKQPISFWIIPIRDFLSFFVRLLCYAGRTVNWRGAELSVHKGGGLDHSEHSGTVDK